MTAARERPALLEHSTRRLAAAVTVACATGLALVACGGSSSTSSSSASSSPSGSSATSSQASSSAASGSGDASAVPVVDAAAVRDRLLSVAKSSNPGTSDAGFTITGAWQKALPSLERALFHDQAATPTTVSTDDSFLTSRASGSNDRIFGFAVRDTSGRCAGGVVVIPAVGGKISDAAPSIYQAVEMSTAPTCSANAAAEVYQPGARR